MSLTNLQKVEFWKTHIEAAEGFEEGIKFYCQAQDLRLATYYKWKKKLWPQALTKKASSFLPIKVAESAGLPVRSSQKILLPGNKI